MSDLTLAVPRLRTEPEFDAESAIAEITVSVMRLRAERDELLETAKALIDNWDSDVRAGAAAHIMRLLPLSQAIAKAEGR